MSSLSDRIASLAPPQRARLEQQLLRWRHDARAETIPPREHPERPAPLSFAQQRLWFLEQLDPGSSSYNLPLSRRLFGALRLTRLRQCLDVLVERHEALRTRFVVVDGVPMQQVDPPALVELPVVDLRHLPADEREVEAQELAFEEAQRPFDLARQLPFRATLLRLSETDHVLLMTMHHIASDGWSMGLLQRELSALYTATGGLRSCLEPLPIQYADFAGWQRSRLHGERLDRLLSYWTQALAGAPAKLELPTDRPRPKTPSFRGSIHTLTAPASLQRALEQLGRERKATMFATLLTAFDVLLSRYCGQDDVVVGTPVAGRTRLELEGLVGLFVNTLVLRVDLSGNPSFVEALDRVREASLQAFAHQELPFERLVEHLQPDRSAGHNPLFQVMFVLQNNETDARPSLEGLGPQPGLGTSKFDLTLAVTEAANGLLLAFEYDTTLLDAASVEAMGAAYLTLLERAVARPQAPLAELLRPSGAERRQLVAAAAGPAVSAPVEPTIHAVFEAAAAATPEAIALRWAGQSLRYRELRSRVHRLAHALRDHGVERGSIVGLSVDRSIELVVGMLAILEAGAAFLPLDPAYPVDRRLYMLSDSGAPLLLTTADHRDALPSYAGRVLCVGDAAAAPEPSLEHEELPRVDAAELAYVIYTSGSTGRPKGVAVPHRGVTNVVAAQREAFALPPGCRVLQLASPSFDAAVFELMLAFGARGSLCLAPRDALLPGPPLAELLDAQQIEVIVTPPSILAALPPRPLPALHTIIAAGEACPGELVTRWGGGRRFFNAYGPTEASIWATVAEVTAGEAAPPIGTPIGDSRAYVLDDRLELVPPGVPGELVLGGPGITWGYLGRRGATAEHFVPDPFGERPGARLYRTGDRVRRRPDGQLQFLGRIDEQVKLRGHRIEPGEIDQCMLRHPAVRAVATVVRRGPSGDPKLVSYFVAEPGTEPAAAQLRSALRRELPEFMLPAALVRLAALPLTPNGKLDPRALPAPELQAQSDLGEDASPPANEVQAAIAAIWCEVLERPAVGIDVGFFDLGGHSLLATRVISRINDELGTALPLRTLFEHPTVARLARRVDASERVQSPRSTKEVPRLPRRLQPVPGAPTEPTPPLAYVFPASFAQRRLWFLHQLTPGSATYNIPAPLRIRAPLNASALRRALDELVRRHESLRTTFVAVDGEAMQVVAPASTIRMERVDLRMLPAAQREAEAQHRLVADARRPFSLTAGPLMRATLLRLGRNDHVFALTVHHIVSDGWSMGILLRELQASYQAFVSGRPAQLSPLPVQYADFSQWQRRHLRGAVRERLLAYWTQRLQGAPPSLELPTDRPRPAVQTHRGAGHVLRLPSALYGRVQALGREHGCTPFMTLLAALASLLGRYTGERDLVIGTPVANRSRPELEGVVGLFVNTLLLRVDLEGDPSVRTLLARTRASTLEAYAHQDLPFEWLVEHLRPSRNLGHNPLFQVMLVMNEAERPRAQDAADRTTSEALAVSTGTSKLDLTLSVATEGEGALVAFEYDLELFDPSTIERLAGHFERTLRGMVETPDCRGWQLPIMAEADRAQVLAWSAGPRAPAPPLVPQAIGEQVRRTPEATAVVHGPSRLTYRELWSRAEHLAGYLARRGVGPEDRVCLCIDRSLELPVAVLAVLMAGAAFVPLDPSYPVERLRFMLEDAAPAMVLTQRHLAPSLPASAPRVICVDADWPDIASHDRLRHPPRLHPAGLAYVIYTSGSTGRPKGAMNTHAGLANRLAWGQRTYPLTAADRVLHKTPTSFDISVWELLWPLTAGATGVMARPQGHRDPEYLAELIDAEQITVAHFVPSMLRIFLEHPNAERCTSLTRVIVSGEALTPDLEARSLSRLPASLHNLYGPTEASIEVTAWDCPRPGSGATVPIGRPTSNTRIYLLDAHLQLVPAGVPAELYIGGVSVGRGYLGRPGLTAERFVPDPYADSPGQRMYRTGDRARYRADGQIEYLGRVDQQVKVRGFRIELGEIESRLRQHPQVADAVVLAHAHAADDLRLVGYVVLASGVEPSSPPRPSLRDHVLETLPEYMVPTDFVPLDRLPQLPNGKLDRSALPRPGVREPQRAYAAPRDELETELAAWFAEILKVDRVGIDDDFFERGGHSLLATRLVARVRDTYRVALPLRRMFETRTVAALAEAIEQIRTEAPGTPPDRTATTDDARGAPLVHRDGSGRHPLSFTQRRLWVLDRLLPGNPTYNVPFVMRLPGPLDVDALERSLQEIVRRHEVLRIHVELEQGEPVQVVAPSLPLALERVDLREGAAPQREAAAQQRAQVLVQRPFDLRTGPLVRAALLRPSDGDYVLVLVLHHMVCDGWSLRILYQELAALYPAFAADLPAPLPPLPIQYSDFVRWQTKGLRGEALEGLLHYWRTQLAGLPPLIELPTDRPRGAIAAGRGALHPFSLDGPLVRRARALGREHGATLFMTLLGGWQALLHRYTDDEDIAVGTAIANRSRPQLEGLIGFFANTLVLRTSLADAPSFRQLLDRVRATTLDAYEHQDVPFELLVEQLQPQRSLSHNPLFQVAFQCTSADPDDPGTPRLTPPAPVVSTGTAKFDLLLSIFDHRDGAQAYLEYDTDLFDDTSASRIAAHFEALLRAVVQQPDRPLRSHALPVASPPPPAAVARPCLASRTVVAAVAEHARARAEHHAVVDADITLTWAQLHRRALTLARGLLERGVVPGEVVGVALEPSADRVEALLGVLYAGGIAVPLDPSDPPLYTASCLRDAAVRRCLRGPGRGRTLPDDGPTMLGLDELRDAGASSDVSLPVVSLDAPALRVYPSRPDATPRGVVLSHRMLARTALDEGVELVPSDRVAVRASPGTGVACFEIFGALTAGACLVVMGPGPLAPRPVGLRLHEHAVTFALLPAAYLPRLAREFPWSLRSVRAIGCDADPRLERSLRDALPEPLRSRVFLVRAWPEAGGIGLVRSLADPQGRDDAPTLGRAVPGLVRQLLDPHGRPVPDGVVGDVCLDGEGLAPRPWRTGMRARRRTDGSLELRPAVGPRLVRDGVRIETGELEAHLLEHPAVREVAVVGLGPRGLRERGPAAFVVIEDGSQGAVEQLGPWLAERLPSSRHPASIESIAALPRTPGGAVDRRALAALVAAREPTDDASTPFVAPRTELERRIAETWQTAFGIDRVGVHDDFFGLGGHSLLATQVVARLSDALGLEIPLRRIFEAPTVAQLAERLAPHAGDAAARPTAIARVPRDGPLPQSYAQQRLWFLDQLNVDSASYNVPVPQRLPGMLDVDALQRALTDLVARHEALRTTFDQLDGTAVQVVGPAQPVDLPVHDLRGLPPAARRSEARRLAELDAREPFDLRRGPLLRAQLVRLSPRDHVLLLCLHHIVCDGWSMEVLQRELSALYRAHVDDRPAELAPLPIQYADFAVWQARRLDDGVLERQLPYWRQALAGAPARLELPTDHPRPPVQAFRGGVHAFELPRPLVDSLGALCREQRVTPFMAAFAAFAVLLQRYSGQDDIVVGTPIANRSRPELEGLIGFFANTLVLRLDLGGDPSFRQLVGRARRVTLDAYEHQDIPFERLVEELEPERSLAYNPLFQVMLVHGHAPGASTQAPDGQAAGSAARGTGLSKFDLTAFFTETGRGLQVGLEYDSALFERATIERMAEHLRVLLAAVLAEPDAPLSSRSLVSDAQRRLLARGNHHPVTPAAPSIHQRFAAQARRTPDVPAIVCDEQVLSYGELAPQVHAWAHYLVERGVGPDARVGIALERSVDLVVAILAVLEAGAAYVPLDPRYPAPRLALMIEDAAVGMLLTDREVGGRLPTTDAELVLMDEHERPPRAEPPVVPGHLDALAYVIYTSGSTGRPKGVAMTHRALANLIAWQIERSSLPEGARTLQFASPSFDVSFQEVLSTLGAGGTLVLPTELQRRDPAAQWLLLERHSIARLYLPYVALQQLAEHAPADLRTSLREVITAGEQLHITPSIARLMTRLRCPLYNQYGPSETHVVTEHPLRGAVRGWPARPPIGRPIPNTTAYVLDARGGLVPVGLPGELYLGGEALARGYLGRPALTAERFVPDPYGPKPGQRLYRTGDRARWLADGSIEFLGRADEQLKIRGYRIEPGEVEAALRRVPGVAEAVVVARGAEDARYLAAYVQPSPGAALTAAALRAGLGQSLPEHTIPSTFTMLQTLPLTPSGKLDRRALPEPEPAAPLRDREGASARTPFEDRMTELWSELLRTDAVGVDDDFFELGGHSLLATRLVSRVREQWGVQLPLRRVFEAPTIEALTLDVVQHLAARHDDDRLASLLGELERASPGPGHDGPAVTTATADRP